MEMAYASLIVGEAEAGAEAKTINPCLRQARHRERRDAEAQRILKAKQKTNTKTLRLKGKEIQ